MKTLRCMAYQEGDVYVATCLDLSLAAQADTMKDAMKKLEEQISSYIQEAISEPQYAHDLLNNRKAPLSLWMKYWYIAFRIFFSKKPGRASLFREDCNVPA